MLALLVLVMLGILVALAFIGYFLGLAATALVSIAAALNINELEKADYVRGLRWSLHKRTQETHPAS